MEATQLGAPEEGAMAEDCVEEGVLDLLFVEVGVADSVCVEEDVAVPLGVPLPDVPLGVAVSDAEPEAHALGDNDARALVEGDAACFFFLFLFC